MVTDEQRQIIDRIKSHEANNPSLGAKGESLNALTATHYMSVCKNVASA
jgi:hypothetical protein